jgi:hypothetical protein
MAPVEQPEAAMTTAAIPAESENGLGIDTSIFVPSLSISLTIACQYYLSGRGGKRLNLEVCRRFANPRKGCRPLGKGGPRIVLPTVLWMGEKRTMPEWCVAFERARVKAGAEATGLGEGSGAPQLQTRGRGRKPGAGAGAEGTG